MRNVVLKCSIRWTDQNGREVIHGRWAARLPTIVASAAIAAGAAVDAQTLEGETLLRRLLDGEEATTDSGRVIDLGDVWRRRRARL